MRIRVQACAFLLHPWIYSNISNKSHAIIAVPELRTKNLRPSDPFIYGLRYSKVWVFLDVIPYPFQIRHLKQGHIRRVITLRKG